MEDPKKETRNIPKQQQQSKLKGQDISSEIVETKFFLEVTMDFGFQKFIERYQTLPLIDSLVALENICIDVQKSSHPSI